MKGTTEQRGVVIEPVSNGASEQIVMRRPYKATVTIKGVADYLFHAWNIEAVEEKARAQKGSKAKKTDDLESYVYRTTEGRLAFKGVTMQRAIVGQGRFRQDPRSPRKSMKDLLEAAVVSLDPFVDSGVKDWDYVSKERVTVQRAAITRARPALRAGWTGTWNLLITLPEFVSPELLHELISEAGRIGGLGDHRPTYGRFQIVKFETTETI